MGIPGAYMFIIAIIAVGAGIGVFLQAKLTRSHQNIELPSAFGHKQ